MECNPVNKNYMTPEIVTQLEALHLVYRYRLEGMIADNNRRIFTNQALAYGEEAFGNMADEYVKKYAEIITGVAGIADEEKETQNDTCTVK